MPEKVRKISLIGNVDIGVAGLFILNVIARTPSVSRLIKPIRAKDKASPKPI